MNIHEIRKYINIVDEALRPIPHDSDEVTFEIDEVAPKGWEGTVKAMKKHKEIDNPWALANYMKNKGYKSHKSKK